MKFKQTFLFMTLLWSFLVMADTKNDYSGDIIVINVSTSNEDNREHMLDKVYDGFVEESPVKLLSSYGKVLNAKQIKFSNLKENETLTLSGEEGNTKELLVELYLYKEKDYNISFNIYSYKNGSNVWFSQDIKEIKPHYVALNGFISDFGEQSIVDTIAFVKFNN